MMGELINVPSFAIKVLTIILLYTIISNPTDGISSICLVRRAFRAILLTATICSLCTTKNLYNINQSMFSIRNQRSVLVTNENIT